MQNAYLLGSPILLSHIFTIFEPRKNLFDSRFLLFQFFHFETLPASPGLLLQVFKSFLNELDIFDSKLLADYIEISDRINVSFNMDDLGIIETANNLEDGINGPDMRKEGVAKPSSSRCPSRQTSDIIDREVGRDPGLWLIMVA